MAAFDHVMMYQIQDGSPHLGFTHLHDTHYGNRARTASLQHHEDLYLSVCVHFTDIIEAAGHRVS